jgi:predicted nucleotidyltransferase
MVAGIRQLIPAADVWLYCYGEACGYGSRDRGDGRADSDVDLLITVPDAWLAQRDRFALLADLWGAVAQPDLSVDLVLHSSSEVARRDKEPGSLVYEAIRDGVLLDGQA